MILRFLMFSERCLTFLCGRFGHEVLQGVLGLLRWCLDQARSIGSHRDRMRVGVRHASLTSPHDRCEQRALARFAVMTRRIAMTANFLPLDSGSCPRSWYFHQCSRRPEIATSTRRAVVIWTSYVVSGRSHWLAFQLRRHPRDRAGRCRLSGQKPSPLSQDVVVEIQLRH